MNVDPGWLWRLAFGAMPVLLDAAAKGAVLLVVAGVLVLAMRKASAAARQVVWLLALAALMLLPMASAALPSWGILPGWVKIELAEPAEPGATDLAEFVVDVASPPPVDPIPEAAPADTRAVAPNLTAPPISRTDDNGGSPAIVAAVPPAAPAARAGAWRRWLVPAAGSLWMAGVLVCLLPLVLGRISLWRLARQSCRVVGGSWATLSRQAAEAVGLRRPIILLQSRDEPRPMGWGMLRPRLLLPAEAEGWPLERRWVVLLHELAHAQRRDCLAKLVAHSACAFYWFNPLCWIAFGLMRRESEAACDDLVLNSTAAPAADRAGVPFQPVRPSDYAQHLLEIASGLRSDLPAAYSSIAMARRSRLEGRLLAILDATRNRRALTRLGLLVVVALIAAVALPLATIRAWDGSGLDVSKPKEAKFLAATEVAQDPGTDTWPDTTTRFLDALRPEIAELVRTICAEVDEHGGLQSEEDAKAIRTARRNAYDAFEHKVVATWPFGDKGSQEVRRDYVALTKEITSEYRTGMSMTREQAVAKLLAFAEEHQGLPEHDAAILFAAVLYTQGRQSDGRDEAAAKALYERLARGYGVGATGATILAEENLVHYRLPEKATPEDRLLAYSDFCLKLEAQKDPAAVARNILRPSEAMRPEDWANCLRGYLAVLCSARRIGRASLAPSKPDGFAYSLQTADPVKSLRWLRERHAGDAILISQIDATLKRLGAEPVVAAPPPAVSNADGNAPAPPPLPRSVEEIADRLPVFTENDLSDDRPEVMTSFKVATPEGPDLTGRAYAHRQGQSALWLWAGPQHYPVWVAAGGRIALFDGVERTIHVLKTSRPPAIRLVQQGKEVGFDFSTGRGENGLSLQVDAASILRSLTDVMISREGERIVVTGTSPTGKAVRAVLSEPLDPGDVYRLREMLVVSNGREIGRIAITPQTLTETAYAIPDGWKAIEPEGRLITYASAESEAQAMQQMMQLMSGVTRNLRLTFDPHGSPEERAKLEKDLGRRIDWDDLDAFNRRPADLVRPPRPASSPVTPPVAGRLEFRIAPRPSDLNEAEQASYRDWLKAGRVGFWWKDGRLRGRIAGRMPDHAWLPVSGDLTNAPQLMTGEYDGRKYLLVSDKPDQTMVPGEGQDAWGLAKTYLDHDSRNDPAVGFVLDDRGAERFAALTQAHVQRVLAIVVDGRVVSAPTLRSALGAAGMITGTFTEEEALDLARALRAGMPAQTKSTLVEEGLEQYRRLRSVQRAMQTLKADGVMWRNDYPQLAGAKNGAVTPAGWLFTRDYREAAKGRYENTGPFPVGIGLQLMPIAEFQQRVRTEQMIIPTYRWDSLGFVGWEHLYTGDGVPGELRDSLQKSLLEVLAKIGTLDHQAFEARLPQEIKRERAARLAKADAEIRAGVQRLAEQFPQLKQGQSWEALAKPSEPGRIDIQLERRYHQPGSKIGTDDQEVPEAERFSLGVTAKPAAEGNLDQRALRPFYPALGLIGQAGASAGDPKLDAALKKLVSDALALLDELETSAAPPPTARPVIEATDDYPRAVARLSQPVPHGRPTQLHKLLGDLHYQSRRLPNEGRSA